ncbi:MAG: sugar-binding domain-containing protein [Spirochaetota bacterium]
MRTIPLTSEWSLSFAHPGTGKKHSISASVPGNSAIDIMREKIIPDLYIGANTLAAQDWERTDITYTCEFTAPKIASAERLEIVFEGIDTVADISVNGKAVASVENMYIPHAIDVTDEVRSGKNTLTVHIKNVIDFAAARMKAWGTTSLEMGHFWDKTPLYVRKAQHMFGWDIAPRILFGGIWRPVYFRIRCEEEILPDDFYLGTRSINASGGRAEIEISFGCSIAPTVSAGRYEIDITGVCAESTFTVRMKLLSPYGKWYASVMKPKLWWPAGYGEQNVYAVAVRLLRDGKEVDAWKTRAGLRVLTLDFNCDTVDTSKSRFGFICNGVPIMARGSNWVPVDALHACDEERIPKILGMFRDTHCNIVRVWGGSVYESDTFYDLCDDYGILVWQDFMLGCAMYPQHEKFRRIIEDEAACIIKKLRHHPSIALWAGDNEIDAFLAWRYSVPSVQPSDNIISRRVLKEAVVQYDHFRSYLPSSPFIPDVLYHERRMDDTPEQHLWGPRGYFKADFYAKNTAVFASEIGYHGMPAKKSMERFLSKEKVWGSYNNNEWIIHAANFVDTENSSMGKRNYLMRDQVRHLFGDSVDMDNIDDFILASQITQAEAKKYFIEHFRSRKPKKTGIIWWNMIDCWPQFSDAIVDYYFEKKIAYEYIKRAQEPVCLMVREDGVKRELVAVNDTLKKAAGTWKVMDAANTAVAAGDFSVDANGSAVLGDIPKAEGFLHIEWTIDGKTCSNHYVNVNSGPQYTFRSEVYGGREEHIAAAWDFSEYRTVMRSLIDEKNGIE